MKEGNLKILQTYKISIEKVNLNLNIIAKIN